MRKLQEGNSWKTVGKRRKRFEKRHEMEEMQSFEKTRNIEAAEEGVAKGCKKRRKMGENVENTFKMEEKMNGKLRKTKEIEETVWKMRKLQEGNSGKTVGTQEKV
jgi:hypothetical protein